MSLRIRAADNRRRFGKHVRRGESRDAVIVAIVVVAFLFILTVAAVTLFAVRNRAMAQLVLAERAAQEAMMQHLAADQQARAAAEKQQAVLVADRIERSAARRQLASERFDSYCSALLAVANLDVSAHLDAHARLDDAPAEYRGWEWLYFRRRADRKSAVALHGHENHVVDVAFDRRGVLIATAGLDGRIGIWDSRTGAQVKLLQSTSEPRASQFYSATFDRDGEQIVSISRERGVEIWDIESGQSRQLFQLPSEVAPRSHITSNPAGSQFAVCGADQMVYTFDVPRRDSLGNRSPVPQALPAHDSLILNLAFSSDGKQLATCGSGNAATIWDLTNRRVDYTIVGHDDAVTAAAFHPRVPLVATVSRDRRLRIWSRQVELASAAADVGLLDVKFLPDGSRLLTTGADGSVRVWDIRILCEAVAQNTNRNPEICEVTMREVTRIGSHAAEAHALAIRPDGTAAASVGGDFMVRIWDTLGGKVRPALPEIASPPRHYSCFRASDGDSVIKVDGRIDEPAWHAAPWSDDFVDIEGDVRVTPRYRTRVKMLWDSTYLYLAAQLDDPDVWATLTQRDSVIFYDNDFELFLDPNGDNHRYGEFELNALNTGWDLFLSKPYRDQGIADDSWEIPQLQTAVAVHGTLNDPSDVDQGWTLEVAIPWTGVASLLDTSSLDQNGQSPVPMPGDVWRINFSRVEWRHEVVEGSYRKFAGRAEDNWVWSPQGAIDMHRPETWGYVQFSSQLATDTARSLTPWVDPAWPARALLCQVYHAQREFHGRNQRWARNLDELQLGLLSHDSLDGPIVLQWDQDGYEAFATVAEMQQVPARIWHIRNDGRLWSSDPRDAEEALNPLSP